MLTGRALALALLLASACGGGRALAPPLEATTVEPGNVRKTVRARLEMRVTGDLTVDLTTETALRIVEILGGRLPEITWFLSVSPQMPIPLDGRRQLIFSADLSPGLYRGPGTYTLSSRPSVNVGPQSGLGSASYVSVITLEPKPAEARYDRLTESCTMVVEEHAVEGRVTCPRLSNADGRSIEVRWNWELI